MWGQSRAIGQRFILWGNLTEVVGVTEDGKYHDIAEPPQAVVYVPLSQSQQTAEVFMVRSQRAPNEMAAALQSTLRSIAPNVPITLQSWSDALSSELFPARAATVALGVMGLLAAMLAVTGIFGMAAYNVSRRTKELGIRVALGARKTHVMSAAVGRPIVLLAAGASAGLLRRLRQPLARANCVPGQSAGSTSGGRCSAHDGAPRCRGIRPSGQESARRRSIQTHARRVARSARSGRPPFPVSLDVPAQP